MSSISIILITQNEADNIRRCLDSVVWADEIIVVDSGSTDGTQAICREYTEHVFDRDWPGFGIQKGRALAKASCEWVFAIDADECVSDALGDEIQQIIQQESTQTAAFNVTRSLVFQGRVMKYVNANDTVLLLFKRTQGQFTEDIVHERIVVKGSVGQLKSTLYHYSYPNLDAMIAKMNRYSSLSAQAKHQAGKKATLGRALLSSLWIFIRLYLIKLGFLDGKQGFTLAFAWAEGTYYRYLKLMYLS